MYIECVWFVFLFLFKEWPKLTKKEFWFARKEQWLHPLILDFVSHDDDYQLLRTPIQHQMFLPSFLQHSPLAPNPAILYYIKLIQLLKKPLKHENHELQVIIKYMIYMKWYKYINFLNWKAILFVIYRYFIPWLYQNHLFMIYVNRLIISSKILSHKTTIFMYKDKETRRWWDRQ